MIRDLDFFLSHTTPNGTCLEWTRCYNTDGYPRAGWKGHSNGKVHRIVWELHNEAEAAGKVIRHTCDNPKCINPEHLELGTNYENIQDRNARGRTHNSISKEEINSIKALLDAGYKQTEVSEMLGIKYKRVSHIKLKLIG